MNKIKFSLLILCTLAISLNVCSCKDTKDQTAKVTNQTEATESQKTYSPDEPKTTVTADKGESVFRLRTYDSTAFHDESLKKGDYISSIPQKAGYTFEGYKMGDVVYIDENGQCTRDYTGTDEIAVVYAEFKAITYEVVTYEGNDKRNDFNVIECNYDKDFLKDLRIGDEITLNSDSNHSETHIITGYASKDGDDVIVDYNTKKITPADIDGSDAFNHDENTIELKVLTTNITYTNPDLSSITVSNKGYLKQSLGKTKSTYQMIDLSETIDLNALKALGYKSAVLHLDIVGQKDAESGDLHIQVLNDEATSKKELKSFSIWKPDKITEKMIDKSSNETVSLEEEISIDKINDQLYLYFNAEPAIVGSWTVNTVTFSITFTK